MQEIIIKHLKPEDAVETEELFHSILDNTFRKTFPEKALLKYKKEWNEESIRLAAGNRDKIMLVAVYGDSMVGLLFGAQINGGVGSIIWVAVSPGMRGKGIGRKLCERAENDYREKGAHKVVLYTETESARDFYKKMGYAHEGTHPKHWWEIDHYCMGKIL